MKKFLIKFKFNNDSIVVENDGFSVWAYLIEANKNEFSKDVFLVSPIEPEPLLDKEYIQNGNPPKLNEENASGRAVLTGVSKRDIFVKATGEGDFCVYLKREPFAAIYRGEQRGFSKSLSKSTGFGNPWSETEYKNTFVNNS